jgi:hypothetical protein
MAHISQSRTDSGLEYQVRVLRALQDAPSSLGSGPAYVALQSVGVRKIRKSGRVAVENSLTETVGVFHKFTEILALCKHVWLSTGSILRVSGSSYVPRCVHNTLHTLNPT